MKCKVVTFSELGASWLPRDHMPEIRKAERLAQAATLRAKAAKMLARVEELEKE